MKITGSESQGHKLKEIACCVVCRQPQSELERAQLQVAARFGGGSVAQAAVRQVTSRACHYTLNSNLGSPLYDPAWLMHRPSDWCAEGSTASAAGHGMADIGSGQQVCADCMKWTACRRHHYCSANSKAMLGCRPSRQLTWVPSGAQQALLHAPLGAARSHPAMALPCSDPARPLFATCSSSKGTLKCPTMRLCGARGRPGLAPPAPRLMAALMARVLLST